MDEYNLETRNATNVDTLFDDLAMNGWEAEIDKQEALIMMINKCVWLTRRRDESGEAGVL